MLFRSDTAAEDFRAALEHGKGTLTDADARSIQAELERVEHRAMEGRSSLLDPYAVLGESACTVPLLPRVLFTSHHKVSRETVLPGRSRRRTTNCL